MRRIPPVYFKTNYNLDGIMCVEEQASSAPFIEIIGRDVCGGGRLGAVA